jgi:Lon protease-like protein
VAELIPLFPLSHVLLPGMPLPLHIFEQRYRDLLDDTSAASGGGRFGVVALRSGTEAATPHLHVDATPDVQAIGTLAEILDVQRAEDGTSDLLCVGSRRFRIESLLPAGDKPYLRARVSFLDEADGDLSTGHAAQARALLERYDDLLARLAGRTTGAELPDDANQLSYQIGARLPLPPEERQALLADATTEQRLVRLVGLLRREIALLRRTRTIAVSPAVVRLVTSTN